MEQNRYAFHETSWGWFKIGYQGEAVTYLEQVAAPDAPDQPTPLTQKAFCQLEEYFQGKRQTFDLSLKPAGTPFQQKVWKALTEIPYGKTCSYQDVAVKIGSQKACRAVGGANNKNPIMIFIPCHRVIGKNGSLTGYGGGLEMKEKLLNLETAAEK